MAIIITSREIHLSEKGAVAQNRIHQADTLEELVPVKGGHQPHAGDDIAYGNGHSRLILVLGADDFIRRSSLRVQPFIEPKQDRANLRIQISQTLDELYRECSIQRSLLKTPENNRGKSTADHHFPADHRRADRLSSRARRLRTMLSANLRRFSTSTTRRVMGRAQSSPIARGCTRW